MMGPLIFLMFIFIAIVVGYVFSLYLFSREESGERYSKRSKFARTMATGPFIEQSDDYYIEYKDSMYDRSTHNARVGLVILFGVVVVVLMLLFMLMNTFA